MEALSTNGALTIAVSALRPVVGTSPVTRTNAPNPDSLDLIKCPASRQSLLFYKAAYILSSRFLLLTIPWSASYCSLDAEMANVYRFKIDCDTYW